VSEPYIQATLVIVVALFALAVVTAIWQDRALSRFFASVGGGVTVLVFIVMMVDDATAPDPVPPPVVMLDALQECYALGGVQMVYADGAWKCVTAEQAG